MRFGHRLVTNTSKPRDFILHSAVRNRLSHNDFCVCRRAVQMCGSNYESDYNQQHTSQVECKYVCICTDIHRLCTPKCFRRTMISNYVKAVRALPPLTLHGSAWANIIGSPAAAPPPTPPAPPAAPLLAPVAITMACTATDDPPPPRSLASRL